MVCALSQCKRSPVWNPAHVYTTSDLPCLMFPTKSSPRACIWAVLDVDYFSNALPVTFDSLCTKGWSGIAARLSLVRLQDRGRSASNVIAVLKITVTDNDNRVSRTASTQLPEELSVQGNYPNPFRTATNIVFDLPEQAQVYAEVFDILGRTVHVTQARQVDAGWDRTLSLVLPHASSGMYFYRINMETASVTHTRTGRIIRVR